MFERQKTEVNNCDFQCSVVWHCFCVSLFMCVFYIVLLSVSLFVQRMCVNHWCASGKNWGKKLRFSMFGCLILFLCGLVYVCVWFTVWVCLYSVCASTTDVRAAKNWGKLLRFSMFGYMILFLCELVYVCVYVLILSVSVLYSVCAWTTHAPAAKTEVKLRCSRFGCVILFLCELMYVCVYCCLCLFVQRLRVNHWCSSGKNWGK